MKIDELLWEDERIEHIASHNVNPKEVEDVCFGLHLSKKAGGRRYVVSGQSLQGRYLNIVVERLGKGLFRPVTAFEMSKNYKRIYKKRIRK